jgi:threonine/homoserine/homoserine lactone efflux protein
VSLIWQGFLLGLGLSILAGPMLFILMQTGIERGFRAGVAAGSGAWVSDIFYIVAVFFGLSYVQEITEDQKSFEFYVALVGGTILIVMGIGALLQKTEMRKPQELGGKKGYVWLWLKCFLINTFNPGAAFFWLGVMSTVVLDGNLVVSEAFVFFSTIMVTIILTDVLKVALAKRIQPWLSLKRLKIIKLISGLALMMFGLVLIVRSCVLTLFF